jgi:1,4-alpha-glucan branching enzyme
MPVGSLAFILHAHLPFVRHPEHDNFLEERWLFEAITETYIPLLSSMQRLQREGVRFKLAMSVTPTLCAMLSDQLLCKRYVRHLECLIAFCKDEIDRHRKHPQLGELSRFYFDLFSESRRWFVEECGCDLLKAFAALRKDGALELIGCAATHGLLPLLCEQAPETARAQLLIGRDVFKETFGDEPFGWWLPECAYSAKLNPLLQEANVRWFVLDAHGIMYADPRPRRAVYAPYYTPAGPAAFARDPESSRQVWSAHEGYPGDQAYREFYRDAAVEHDEKSGENKKPFAGVKYFRITGQTEEKEHYDPQAAAETAARHAGHFIGERERQARQLADENFDPITVAPFDAELFGHWWFEGPRFFEQCLRLAAASDSLALKTPSEFLISHPTQQMLQPAASSWGEKGHFGVWLDPLNAWIYPLLHVAGRQMIASARKYQENDRGIVDRFLKQMARELLLAQSSDWAFLIKNGTAREYATARTRDHLARFDRLHGELEKGVRDETFLSDCEGRDNLFPNLNWRHYIG